MKKLIPVLFEKPAKNPIFFPAMLISLQAIFIILLALHADYGRESLAGVHSTSHTIFQNIHVMIFVGFGFLLTFFRCYG